MRYRCEDCGREFNEPSFYEEHIGDCFGGAFYDVIDICPFCRSECITDTEEIDDD